MSKIHVRGLRPLYGEIEIQGSKNAVLPMMAAAVLHKGITVLTNVPRIQDVFCMMGILESMGCVTKLDRHELFIDAGTITAAKIPEHDVRSMRSSIMVLGALLGRTKEAETNYPGGCSIGKRPIDLHLYALRQLGAVISEEGDVITAKAERLVGSEMSFPYPSVGATENAMLGAVLAEGVTIIRGAAREPEIEELCRFLNAMGARILGAGTDCLIIEGVRKLYDTRFCVVGDRIVAGTYLTAVMASSGSAVFKKVNPLHLSAAVKAFRQTGAIIEEETEAVRIAMKDRPQSVAVKTGPYPQFPTDLQSPAMAALSVASGRSVIEETVFEGRFGTAEELKKLGADIVIEGTRAYMSGRYPLRGTDVNATDLRGGAALVVAGLAAEGETRISQCGHILRGYEDICRDLRLIGADAEYA